MAHVVAFRSRGQQHAAARSIDRLARRLDALDRDRQIVQRRRPGAGGILDRQSGDPARHTSSDAVRHVGRFPAISRREVGVDRQIDCAGNLGDVGQDPITGDGDIGVRQPLGKGKAGAGRRQRRKAQMLQIPRRADVPRVRDHEAAPLVQRAERLATGAKRGARIRGNAARAIRCNRRATHRTDRSSGSPRSTAPCSPGQNAPRSRGRNCRRWSRAGP